MADNRWTRAFITCPLCQGFKPVGLVACWPCFREWDMRDGNPKAEEIIEAYEEALAARC